MFREAQESNEPRCGLCGASKEEKRLTRTECCGQWICDDEDAYVMFSYARNSCHRNHRRLTLCSIHFESKHPGRWQDCELCRQEINPEIYAYYGTNEYNFEVLDNPPPYKPTHCDQCGQVIVLSEGGYSVTHKGEFKCDRCTDLEDRKRRRKRRG